jgi:hypothetical protein
MVITIITCNIFVVSPLVYQSIVNENLNFHKFISKSTTFLNWFTKINGEFSKLGMELEKKNCGSFAFLKKHGPHNCLISIMCGGCGILLVVGVASKVCEGVVFLNVL